MYVFRLWHPQTPYLLRDAWAFCGWKMVDVYGEDQTKKLCEVVAMGIRDATPPTAPNEMPPWLTRMGAMGAPIGSLPPPHSGLPAAAEWDEGDGWVGGLKALDKVLAGQDTSVRNGEAGAPHLARHLAETLKDASSLTCFSLS